MIYGGNMKRKLVFVLPRAKVTPTTFGQSELRLGKATFLPDTDATWHSRIALPRPSCLDIFREFPWGDDPTPPPSRGTLLISDDEPWLRENVGYLVAVTFVLGIQDNSWSVPAEAFQYYDITVGEKQNELVQFHTKFGSSIEVAKDFQLLPPLEVRGVNRPFRINPRTEEFAEFSKRLACSLPDRLIVACHHLFRTQFANGFLASSRQDYAAYCACLEAAFDTPKSQDGGRTLADCLEEFYLPDLGLREFAEALYEERSVFNHGVSEAGLEPHRQRMLCAFRGLPFRWDLLRHICVDLVLEKAREAIGKPRGNVGTFFSHTFKQIETCFSSKDTWESLCKELTSRGSVKTLLGLQQPVEDTEQDDARLSAFIGLCCQFLMCHQWSSLDAQTETHKALTSLKCLAEIIFATTDDEEIKAAATSLYEASKAGEKDQLGEWAARYASWTMLRGYESLCDAAQAVASHIARLFYRR